MADLARALNGAGIERLRAYLAQLRAGARTPPPVELLADPAATVELPADVWLERKLFASRWGADEYLWQLFQALPHEHVEGNRGLWAWLSLYYFDQVCPAAADGARKPGRDYRHVPEFGFRYGYRHLLYGPYAVYRRHRGHAILLLSGRVHQEQRVYQEITSRTDLIASRGVLEALNLLYLDRGKGTPKRGAQAATPRPGTVLRFVRVLQQLDVTYDIYGMTGQEILELLPPEFDDWRGQGTMFG